VREESNWRKSRWLKAWKTCPGTLKILENPCHFPNPIEISDKLKKVMSRNICDEGTRFVHVSPSPIYPL